LSRPSGVKAPRGIDIAGQLAGARPVFGAKARPCPGVHHHRVIAVPIAGGMVDAWIDPGVSGTVGSATEINWAHGPR
jgi:hypothetical protein